MKAFAAILAACLAGGALAASADAGEGAVPSRLQEVDGSLGALNNAQHDINDKANARRAVMRGKKKRKKSRRV
ncbi:hypothetical protein HIM_02091 [Hirsutella minnesotensis 3608]|nr:hypothetical protein HIM_02091 [Hirsutella minnesotensis 3608]